MKNLFLLFIAFLFIQYTSLAQEGWFWQNPLPQGNSLWSVVFFTEVNTGTVVGTEGTILRTTDGGVNWIAQSSGTTNHLYGVSFTDANT